MESRSSHLGGFIGLTSSGRRGVRPAITMARKGRHGQLRNSYYCNPASMGWNFEPPAVNPFPNRIRPDKKPRPGVAPRGAVRWAVQDSNLQPWD